MWGKAKHGPENGKACPWGICMIWKLLHFYMKNFSWYPVGIQKIPIGYYKKNKKWNGNGLFEIKNFTCISNSIYEELVNLLLVAMVQKLCKFLLCFPISILVLRIQTDNSWEYKRTITRTNLTVLGGNEEFPQESVVEYIIFLCSHMFPKGFPKSNSLFPISFAQSSPLFT